MIVTDALHRHYDTYSESSQHFKVDPEKISKKFSVFGLDHFILKRNRTLKEQATFSMSHFFVVVRRPGL